MRQFVETWKATARFRWGTLLLGAAMLYALVFYLLPALSSANNGDGACTRPQSRVIGSGPVPGGATWRVRASVSDNSGCETWLLKANFEPSGGYRGSWSGGWQIPAHGHLPASATIAAHDTIGGTARSFSGLTGLSVRRVVLITNRGERIEIRPKLPSAELRKRFVWLRGLRYFVRYYATEQHAIRVKLLNAHGRVTNTLTGEEGFFEGPMGSP